MINRKQSATLIALVGMGILMVGIPAIAQTVPSFLYTFDQNGTVKESSSLSESSSPYWWLNSGGYLKIQNGVGSTNLGELAKLDPWSILYAKNNPLDTDLGLHPQNIFRLVTKSKWQNAEQEAYFLVKKDNLSASPNRNASNGLLLFNRYQDSDNLYYTGVRVDGSAIIKKKQNGVYTTLAEVKNVFGTAYDSLTNPNLIPKNTWIGLRSQVVTNSDGSVTVKLFLDKGRTGSWKLVAQTTDKTKPIIQAGYGGIRTDFMDVQFENFRFKNL